MLGLLNLKTILEICSEIENDKMINCMNNWTVSDYSYHRGKKEAFLQTKNEIENILKNELTK